MDNSRKMQRDGIVRDIKSAAARLQELEEGRIDRAAVARSLAQSRILQGPQTDEPFGKPEEDD